MRKSEYIEMLIQENNEEKTKKLYGDVIDCIDIALSQENADFEIKDTSLGLADFYKMLETKAKTNKVNCVGPFEAAEMFAEKLGARYTRLSKRTPAPKAKVNLEDFI